MARKKADADIKQNNPTSYRFSAETNAELDALNAEFGLSKTALLEAGIKLIRKGLNKVTAKETVSALGIGKNPRRGT